MKRQLKLYSGVTLFIMLVSLCTVYAQESASLSDEQVKERLGFIENALHSAQPRARTWWYGWIGGYSAGAVILGGLSAANWNTKDKRDFAEDMLVGSATFALGVGGLLIDPFVPAYAPRKMRLMPESTPEERRAKLLKAEGLLRECARREKDGQGWLTHLLNLGANIAAGLVTVYAFDRSWSDGLMTIAIGEAVSLLNIYTQPRRAIRDLHNYEIKFLGKQGAPIAEAGESHWFFSVYPCGFSVRLQF
jgi:hypothetical protein